MSEPNLTLLTQVEIDTLISFLVDKKQNIQNEVLSQESIDKLIYLIQNNDAYKLRLDAMNLVEGFAGKKLLRKSGFYENKEQTGRLVAEISEETGYLELFALNADTEKRIKITPENFSNLNLEENESQWGYVIAPTFFDEIAEAFELKYSKEMLDFVCAAYAEKNYGDRQMQIPSAFLPESKNILSNLS